VESDVNARVASLESGRPAAARAEHISLESTPDIAATALKHPHRKSLARFQLASKLRSCETELSLLEDHYLAVCSQRGKEPALKYVVDLRFASPRPVIVRYVAWAWLAAFVALLVAGGAGFWLAFAATPLRWSHPGLTAGGACLLLGAVALLLFLRRTTESLQFLSVHGDAILVNAAGSIGSAKSGRRFFVEVIKSISAAKHARPQPRPQFLRDEMREHHRLHELHVLSDAAYEASKARILAAHQ
jgi:hypothetical protein